MEIDIGVREQMAATLEKILEMGKGIVPSKSVRLRKLRQYYNNRRAWKVTQEDQKKERKRKVRQDQQNNICE